MRLLNLIEHCQSSMPKPRTYSEILKVYKYGTHDLLFPKAKFNGVPIPVNFNYKPKKNSRSALYKECLVSIVVTAC